MSQTPGENSGQPATARAEEVLNNLGRRMGLFTAQAGQRIQNVAASIREEADRLDQPETAPGEKSKTPLVAQTEEQGKLPKERAEVLVDRMGQRVSNWASRTGFQVQRAAAFMREEVEDMWAEAQNIRRQKGRPPQ
jgi:tRNA U34 5-carboxymethylaminomethyl modifying enzyme MnmG/GidA